MRSGTTLTELVEFSEGFPDGDISWSLLDGSGDEIAAGTVTPEAEAASAVITLTGVQNSITEAGAPIFANRELGWSYLVNGAVIHGRRRYRLEAFLPLGLSEDGVRTKLGLESHELEDSKIDLVGAFSRFQDTVGADELAAVSGNTELLARDAIEAMAALALLPALQVSIAAKESSGTNQFARGKIQWDELRAELERQVADGQEAVNPNLDPTADFSSLLVVVVRDDPVTGETA